MKNLTAIFIPLFLLIIFNSCGKDEEIDKEKPIINLTAQNAFPLSCDTLYFGESFDLKALFSDNVELGSFSIDIHNNFDHHSHSTEVAECNPDPIKTPVTPFLYIEEYDIPTGQTEYQTNLSISIPSGDENGLFDEGDYHFFISLTDKEGWSKQKGLNIKMLHR
ncbi:DUF4625 domain-containing protein [Labilibaculum sp. A4]|uniref:DUF4625 domain-containing protein n=1 Tax=Labilibaculum euxinus TaxID=2686357 RepID=UPI000F628359|nr:DUF4625 domain-containing protein [Labilibaculum euxinus]MDQ1772994.1 DUF4625 domain-containing protein [Labilibaculum euxinus]MWN78468.1 DUF4625 domain-containing protein [Labilibaculum euxinus]